MTSFSKCKLDMKFWILWIRPCRGTYIHIELVVFLWKICPQKTQCVKNEVDMKWLWTGLPAPKGERKKEETLGSSISHEKAAAGRIPWFDLGVKAFIHMKGCEWDSLNSCYFPIIVHLVLVQYLSYECTCYQKQWSDWSHLGSNK